MEEFPVFVGHGWTDRALSGTIETRRHGTGAEAGIFGWGQIPGLFACIVETAHRHGAEAYLWMPCFADTDFEGRADPLVPWDRTETKGAATCPGETFRFICPSSEKNLEEIFSAWERDAGRTVCFWTGSGIRLRCFRKQIFTDVPARNAGHA